MRDGALLSEALAAQGSFPPVYVTAITAGERSGNLSGVLEQYISYLRVSTGFKKALITALIYPAILVVAVIVIVTYLVTYAMPQFAKLYQDLGIQLPPSRNSARSRRTRCAIIFWYSSRSVAGVVAGIIYLDALRSGRARHRPAETENPDLRRYLAESPDRAVRAHAFHAVGRRHAAGCRPGDFCAAIGSRLIATSVQGAASRVREGKSLHESLAETRLVPDLALEMIEVGEASGALAAMLTSVAEFYEEEVSTRLQRTLIWVSPVILVVMAVVVGFILISLYLPLFSLQVGTGG